MAAWNKGDSVETVLSMCRAVKETYPDVLKVWEQSAFNGQLRQHVAHLERYEAAASIGIILGTIHLQDPAVRYLDYVARIVLTLGSTRRSSI